MRMRVGVDEGGGGKGGGRGEKCTECEVVIEWFPLWLAGVAGAAEEGFVLASAFCGGGFCV